MVDDICHSSIQTLNLLRFTHFNPGHLREHHPSHICQWRHKPSKSLVGFCSIQENGVKGSSTIGEKQQWGRERKPVRREACFLSDSLGTLINQKERMPKGPVLHCSPKPVGCVLSPSAPGTWAVLPRSSPSLGGPCMSVVGSPPLQPHFCRDPAVTGDPCSRDAQHSTDDTEQSPWSPQPSVLLIFHMSLHWGCVSPVGF